MTDAEVNAEYRLIWEIKDIDELRQKALYWMSKCDRTERFASSVVDDHLVQLDERDSLYDKIEQLERLIDELEQRAFGDRDAPRTYPEPSGEVYDPDPGPAVFVFDKYNGQANPLVVQAEDGSFRELGLYELGGALVD